jgi:hypothetical protein
VFIYLLFIYFLKVSAQSDLSASQFLQITYVYESRKMQIIGIDKSKLFILQLSESRFKKLLGPLRK